MVGDEYEDMFPGQVVSVETLHNTTTLEKLAVKYEKLNHQMWDLIGEYSRKLREGKTVKRKQVTGHLDELVTRDEIRLHILMVMSSVIVSGCVRL